MKICILDRDLIRMERLMSVCEKVLLAMNVDAKCISVTKLTELKRLLNEKQTVIIFNADNDVVSPDKFVDLVITSGCEAVLLAVAESKQKLYRFLPANPFGLILTDSIDSVIIMRLSEAVEHLRYNS